MDVMGLYPSVPKKEGLDACKQALDNRPNPSIPTTDVLSMIRLVLENNNFSFNGKHYLQVEVTAIGSRLGMNYASTYLGEWEQQFDGFGLLSNACLHASKPSFLGTLGYKPITSMQNKIESPGSFCSIEFNLFIKSVVSCM
jgi:hypothetical protein